MIRCTRSVICLAAFLVSVSLLKAQSATKTDTSPHTVQMIQVEPDIKLEVLDWGLQLKRIPPTRQPEARKTGFSATSFDKVFESLPFSWISACQVPGLQKLVKPPNLPKPFQPTHNKPNIYFQNLAF